MMDFSKFLENYSVDRSEEERQQISLNAQGFNSDEDARSELDELLDIDYPIGYRNMPDEIELYRIIFLDDSNTNPSLDVDNLGEHWLMNKELVKDGDFLEKVRNNSGSQGDPIVVVGKFITKDINWETTLHNNMTYPREYEVTVTNMDPISYDIYHLDEFTKT